ncbi:HlyD family efflux transporter periplasmic adaptor subunit [Lyngbya aestuarii]|uniref:HlyD family efflux transporter periplasmic adaptor subunit n=1 Tax=Lyngbya aestuarii TaxID=118322 RepID=UPI00403DB5BD
MSDTNPEFLQPVEPDEFLPPIGWWTIIGGLVLLGGFGAAIILASVLQYKITVKAPATIRPVGELRIVQAATEGIVKSIEVRENQSVKRGEVIAYIDDSRLQTQSKQLQTNIQQNQRQLEQISAQVKALNEQISAESDRAQRTVAATRAELERVQREYKDKRITTQAEVQEAEAALELARDELARYEKLADTGAIAQLQIEERQASLKTATARLRRIKTALNPSVAPVTAAQEQIAREQATGKATSATLRREREALTQRRIEIQNQIERDRQELQQTKNDLAQSVIEAPTDGTIIQLNLRNPGQFVRQTDTITRIAPSQVSLLIKALVQTQDRDKIALDQEVDIRIDACPYPSFGTLQGTVQGISADAITPQSSGTSNQSVASAAIYEVTIEPESLSLKQGKRQCVIQPGMTGRADIISQKETFLTFMLRKARLLTDL